MLRMYVMDRPSKWEDYLHLAEFAYNNSYQSSIKMSLFEALHGRKCHTPLSWSQPEYKLMLGPDALQEMERIFKQIQINIKTTQYRQKNYADKKRVHREFKVGEHVYLRIKPKYSTLYAGSCEKWLLDIVVLLKY